MILSTALCANRRFADQWNLVWITFDKLTPPKVIKEWPVSTKHTPKFMSGQMFIKNVY